MLLTIREIPKFTRRHSNSPPYHSSDSNMAERPNSRTTDDSLQQKFSEQAERQPPDLDAEFRSAHVYPIMNSDFRQSAKSEDRNRDLSKPAPTLTPKGAMTVQKEMPTEAEKGVDPAKLPKMVKERQTPSREFTNVAGKKRQQERQMERER